MNSIAASSARLARIVFDYTLLNYDENKCAQEKIFF
jgi:hypothetical protein